MGSELSTMWLMFGFPGVWERLLASLKTTATDPGAAIPLRPIVGYSYKATDDPAAPATSQLTH